jgi:hypothetical protein
MTEKRIANLLENSAYNNPVIIKNKYGYTKFWKEKGIKFICWGKNWIDKEPTTIESDVAIEIILKSRLGIKV